MAAARSRTIRVGLDKLVDPEGFAKFVVEPYLGFLPHQEPLTFVTWTYLAAAAELAGGPRPGVTRSFVLSSVHVFVRLFAQLKRLL